MRSHPSPACTLAFALALVVPRAAAAQPPDPDLLERLSHHVEAFEQIEKRASFHQEQLMEELDRDGKVESRETRVSHVERDGDTTHEVLESCVRDGKDVTADERGQKGHEVSFHLQFPHFSTDPSDEYTYDQVGVDARDPSRVQISFTPKRPSKQTVEGTAWVDRGSGTILTAGAKLSKPPTFVDWAHFTVEFGAKTPLGATMSRLAFEAKAGFLFLVRKHVRGEIRMSDYRLTP